jgi:hypothetical protein
MARNVKKYTKKFPKSGCLKIRMKIGNKKKKGFKNGISDNFFSWISKNIK